MSLKRDLTQTESQKLLNSHEKYSKTNVILAIAQLRPDHSTVKCSMGQRGQTKTRGEENMHVNC